MKVWPSVVIAAVLATVVGGGYVVAEALETPAGPPVAVAGTVAIQPLSGWEVGSTRSSGGFEGIPLSRGSANLDVLVTTPAPGGLVELADRFIADVLEPQAERLSVSPELEPVRVAGGRAGARFRYVGVFSGAGAPIEGEVTVTTASSGAGVVFDAWGPEGQLRFGLPDVHAMLDAAEVI